MLSMGKVAVPILGALAVSSACYVYSSGILWSNKSNSVKPEEYQEGTLGNIYGSYLLSYKDHEKEWNELLKRRSGEEIDTNFNETAVPVAFRTPSDKYEQSLNKTCHKKYALKIKNSDNTDGTIEIGGSVWKTVWKLCSTWNPKLISEDTDEATKENKDGTIGKTKEKELLSTKGEDNKALWELKNEKFFKLEQAPTEHIFKELYGSKNQTERPTLKDKCKEAYQVQPSTENQPSEDQVVKYCSLKNF